MALFEDPRAEEFRSSTFTGAPNTGNRFNFKIPGSGNPNVEFPSKAFDQLVRSRFETPTDLGEFANLAGLRGSGGFGNAAFNTLSAGAPADVLAALDRNETLARNKRQFDAFFDDETKAAFKSQGIDIDSINSAEDLLAIPPELKGSVFGAVQDAKERTKQAKNQRPKSGILDSFPGKIALGLTGLFNPAIPAVLGGGFGLHDGGNLIDVAKGAATGLGLGNFTNQFTASGIPPGVNPLDLIQGGKGTVRPDELFDTGIIGDATGIGFDPTSGGNALTFGTGGGGGIPNPGGGDIDVRGGTATSPTNIPTGPPPAPTPGIDPGLVGILGGGLLGTGTGDTGTGTGDNGDGSGRRPELPTLAAGGGGGSLGPLPKNRGPFFRRTDLSRHIKKADIPNAGDKALRDMARIYPGITSAFNL